MEWVIELIKAHPIIFGLVFVAIPAILPNKTVYKIFNPIGLAIRKFSITTQERLGKGKAFIAYLLNTISTAFEAVGDGTKGENKYKGQ